MTWVALVQSLMDQHTKDSASISSNCLFTWRLPREVEAPRKCPPWSCPSALRPPSGQQGSPYAERLTGWLQPSGQADVIKTHLCHWMTRTLCPAQDDKDTFTEVQHVPGASPRIFTATLKCRYYHHFHFKDDRREASGDDRI